MQLTNGQDRLVVLLSNGNILIKDGHYNAAWTSLTGNPANEIYVGGDRIGMQDSSHRLYVKQLTPGTYTDPNSVPWQLVARNVLDAKLTNSRIVYQDLTKGYFYGKDGAINAPWFGNHAVIYDGMAKSGAFDLGGNRFCVVKVGYVACKEGSLGAQSTPVWRGNANVSVSSDRIVVYDTKYTRVLEGSIYGPNSGWHVISDNHAANVYLNK